MHNADTTGYSLVEFTQQGLRIETRHDSSKTVSVLQVDSFNGTIELGSYNELTLEQSIIHMGKLLGIEILSSLPVTIQPDKINIHAQNEFSFKSGSNASIEFNHNSLNKLIIKTVGLPLSCSGVSSGTWYKDSNGFLKICP